MTLYLDTAYIAKCYLNEPDAPRVRALVKDRTGLTSSAWCRVELACVLRRHVRERHLTARQAHALHALFLDDVRSGAWTLIPVSSDLLERAEERVRALRKQYFVRAGDALHLTTAAEAGLAEIWTNDRHMLACARAFRLRGRSV